jgi:hypothetical protein
MREDIREEKVHKAIVALHTQKCVRIFGRRRCMRL